MPIQLPLDDQQAMLAFVDRRHPSYSAKIEHWEFCEATYEGGREWFTANLFTYLKEGITEFKARLKRAYRFNHTREVTNLVTKYIFKEGVIRNTDDAPDAVRTFWKSATLSGAPVDVMMKRVSDKSSTAGRAWIAVDNNVEPNSTIADAKSSGAKIYAYLIGQQDVLDYAHDNWGELLWIKYRIPHRDDADPVQSSGGVVPRYMLWTRDEWVLLEEQHKPVGPEVGTVTSNLNVSVNVPSLQLASSRADSRHIVLVDRGPNQIAPAIPVFPVDHMESDDPYAPPGLIDEIAYLDRSVANYLSNLDAIIQDQTFSQLIVPAQNLLPGEEGYDKLLEMGTKRIFTYDGEGGGKPEYIAPDAAQAALVISVVKMIIGEIYHSVGMSGERTKQDNAQGIDNSSGVAKAYDFERMNALLCAKADQLDRAENKLVELVCLWARVAAPTEDLIKYPESYDVRALPDEFEIAQNLAILEAPASLRREQMTSVVDKLWPRLAKAVRATILKDLEEWPQYPLDKMQDLMQLQKKEGFAPQGQIKMQSAPSGGAPAGGNKSGLSGPTGKGKSKQGQAGTK